MEYEPVVIVAPELRGDHEFAVIREPDETESAYRERCELVDVLLAAARASR